jgi:type II secretory pathway pseudopilin PulG
MIVAAIIGILAMIAIPKFAGLIIKSKEAAVKGTLSAFRGAIHIATADNDGVPPIAPVSMTDNGRYLNQLPRIDIPTIPSAHGGNFTQSNAFPIDHQMAFGAAWWYPGAADPLHGTVFVNCTHTDSRGIAWSTY